MPRYVVCVPAEGGSPSVAPCADADGISYVPSVVQLPAPGEVSFGNSNTLFAYGFQWVLVFWGIGICVGAILSVIRRGH